MDVVRRKLMLVTTGTYKGLRLRSIDRIPEYVMSWFLTSYTLYRSESLISSSFVHIATQWKPKQMILDRVYPIYCFFGIRCNRTRPKHLTINLWRSRVNPQATRSTILILIKSWKLIIIRVCLFMFALRFNLALCSLLILFNLSKTETVKEMDETRYWPGLRSPHSLLQHSFYS